ncbi:MAG TPA: hypothetical protein VK582_12545 [Pyrinomonadaceae bacterium]|nr:hypothetical protein [Pyrinomonadaceae bacterium]
MTTNDQVDSNGSQTRKRLAFLGDWLQGRQNVQTSDPVSSFLKTHLDDDRKEVGQAELDKKYIRPAAEYDHPMWRLGWTDGRSGQPPIVNEKLIEAHARIEWNEQIAEAREEFSRTKEEVASLIESKSELEKHYTDVETRFEESRRKRAEHFQDFSRKQAWGYFVFGTATLIADIPLSLRLVATGFGVKTSMDVNGQILSVDQILSLQFFQVVSYFWEALVLALGIAFASILLKYFFDLIVFRQPGIAVPRVVAGLLWGGLSLFVITTVCLGVFRYRIQPQVEAYERRQKWENLKQQRIDENYKELLPIFVREKDPPAVAREKAKEIVNREIGSDPTPDFHSAWGLPTFIFLTLLFPIVTAVCFSVGGKKFRNAFLFKSLEEERSRLTEKLRQTNEKLFSLRGMLAACETALETVSRADTKDDLLQRFRYMYRHGYERGMKNVPSTMEGKFGSIYQLSLEYLQRRLAKRIRTAAS